MKRSAEVLREEGLKSFWFQALGATVYRRAIMLERLLDRPIPKLTARIPIDISLCKRDEAQACVEHDEYIDAQEFQHQLDVGHWYAMARYEGRFVYTRWVAPPNTTIRCLLREIRLADDEAYLYASYVSPDFRGKNIHPAVTSQVFQYLQNAGCRRVVTLIEPENTSSLRADNKLGYQSFGRMGYIKIGPRRWDFCRTIRGGRRLGEANPGESPDRI